MAGSNAGLSNSDAVHSKPFRVDANVLLGIIGLALLHAVILTACFCAPAKLSSLTLQEALLAPLLALAAATIVYLLMRFMAEQVESFRKTRLCFVIASICFMQLGLMFILVWLLQLPTLILLVSWSVFGASLPLIFTNWAVHLSGLGGSATVRAIALTWVLAGLWLLLLSQLDSLVFTVTLFLSTATTVLLLFLVGSNHTSSLSGTAKSEIITVAKSRERFEFSHYTPLVQIAWGAAIALLAQQLLINPDLAGSATNNNMLISISLSCVGLFLLIGLALTSRRFLSFSLAERITFPVLVLAVLVIPLDNPVATIICETLLISLFFLLNNAVWATLITLAVRYKVQLTYHFARGRMPLTLGTALGWAAGIFLHIYFDEIPYVVAIAAAVFLTVVVSIAPLGSDSLSMRDAIERQRNVEKDEAAKGAWRKATLDVADAHRLTPRETEVLLLLAKGRTAATVARSLTVTESTAKTHIYHVYQKLSVSTQQELIDLLESTLHAPAVITEPANPMLHGRLR